MREINAKNAELISCDFLEQHGFIGPIRYFDNRRNQFGIYYEIEGHDCKILVSPCQQYLNEMHPGEQVEKFSSIEQLKEWHTGDWYIYVNDQKNHVATFHFVFELTLFMRVCGEPLKRIVKQKRA